MTDGIPFLDIVFFALIAGFLVLRLRSVLGRRDGFERPPERPDAVSASSEDKIVDLAAVRRSVNEPPAESPVGQGLAAVRAADPRFDLDAFLAGARGAFEMIVGAYAASDKGSLKPLLAPEVYAGFAQAIDQRLSRGESLSTELISFRKLEVVEAGLEGTMAVLTVRIITEQVNALLDHQGQILEGGRDRVVEVEDIWTFRRETRSPDPNWVLSATRTPEA